MASDATPNKNKILNRFLELTPNGLIYGADPCHVDLRVNAFNFAESSGAVTPGLKQTDGENEASKSLDRATFNIGKTKDQKIAPGNESGKASGSVHLARQLWADMSFDEKTGKKRAEARLAYQVCALQGQSAK